MAKLLLVEDDNNLREIYEARLQAEGYQIVSARDGEEALVVAKAEKPDLVISDVMMPKISGFEMLDILRNTEGLKQVKVIMLTALGQSDDQKRADKLGADRYLVKSQVTLEDIVKTAHELLGDEAVEASADSAPAATTDQPAEATDTPASDATTAPAEPVATEPAAAPAEPPAAAPTPEPAPAVVEEPKPVEEPAPAPAPAPEPAPAEPVEPEPKPAEEPKEPEPTPAPAQPAADTAASSDAAQSTVQEEADVEAKIEDFVTGASSEPTAPAADNPASTTADEPATATPAPTDQPATDEKKTDSTAASDDKLMAEAVDQLVASTGKDTAKDTVVKPEPAGAAAPSAPPAKATSIPVNVADTDAPKPDAEPAPAAEEQKPEESGGGSMNREKVIQPPKETDHKKDIKELLAEEEAKESQTVPGAVIAGAAEGATGNGEDEDKPSGAPAPSPSEAAASEDKPGGVDPNSIAL